MPLARARTILHVDMDAFFASVEQRDDASLRGKPVIVGGPSRRGVVCAASYEARPFGVRSAMPVGEALRRCPQALVVPPRREAYSEASSIVFSIFRRFTPLVEGLSLDEAFLDVSGCEGLFGDGVAIAKQIKRTIFEETQLRASAGVGPTKFTAKIASDLRKPDGLVEVPEDVPAFLAPMGIERIWGVGPKTAEVLRAAGLGTIGHVARADATLLQSIVGESLSAHLHALARGHDPREVQPWGAPKSIGAEETYEHDITDRESLERHLLAQSERVCRRALREGWEGRVVVLKIKMADFSLKTRRTTLEAPVRDTRTLYQTVCELSRQLDPLAHGGRVRLSGVALQGLSASGSGQRALFPDVKREKREALEATMLRLSDRFGNKAITRADTLLADGGMGGNDPRRRSLGRPRRPLAARSIDTRGVCRSTSGRAHETENTAPNESGPGGTRVAEPRAMRTLLLLGALVVIGCSNSSDDAVGGQGGRANGGTSGKGGATNAGAAGTAGTTSAGTGGTTSGGTGGTGGTTSGGTGGTGGATSAGRGGATSAGTGGAPSAGTGGTGGAGTAGAGGTTSGGTGGTGGAGTGGAGGTNAAGTGGSAGAASVDRVVGVPGIAAWDALSASERDTVKTAQSFFLHQSVGTDLEDGAEAIGYKFEYLASGGPAENAGLNGGLFNASNGDYQGKLTEWVATATANQSTLRLAIMKLGYADVRADTVEAVKVSYTNAVNAIKAKQLRVLHVTPPLVYALPEDNAPKMALRTWMIETFPSDVIFDLQDVESTNPETGARCEREGSWEICDNVRSTAACASKSQGVDAPSGQGHICFEPRAKTIAKAFLYAIRRAEQ